MSDSHNTTQLMWITHYETNILVTAQDYGRQV